MGQYHVGDVLSTQVFIHFRIMGQAHDFFPVSFRYHYLADNFQFILHNGNWWSPFSHQYLICHAIVNMNLLCLPELSKKCVEISRTYQNAKSKVKTCKQLDVFLINYLHWWCNVRNNKQYYNEQSNISYSLYIHSISSLGYNIFTINLYFNSSQYYPTLDKTIAIQLSLHLICFIIRLYPCNIDSHLVNQWFSFCILLINMTVL